jgi:hypothetical protein
VPLLEAATADDTYRWNVVKLLALMELDANHPAEAARLMQPFRQVAVTEFDQAYIVAAIDLADGRKAEARATLNQFPPATLSPIWKQKFEKLLAAISR